MTLSLINGAQEKNLIPLFMSMFIPNYIQNLAVGITNLLAAPDRREKRSADESWSDYFYRANCAGLKGKNTTG
ncbi:unnamed protein product [Orchesella dallaii]|uniref:Uncharacterized protein n=1 Tax=Orchesella dallaii TaxID=48710 RepID=A0ABP1R2F3_9HEXA